ncbi:hypothetical protein ACWEOE_17145 [Amycolatopsis sp. NPDC004368]
MALPIDAALAPRPGEPLGAVAGVVLKQVTSCSLADASDRFLNAARGRLVSRR